MIRIGIVGCGRILAAHLRGYRLLREAGVDDFRITALCARRLDDARKYVCRGQGPPQRAPVSNLPGDPLAVGDEYLSDFQRDVEVELFTDYRRMIAAGPIDAVNDFTTHGLHHQVAESALTEGKDLLTQKPLAVSVAAGRRMCELAESRDRVLAVFENFRYTPATRQLKWLFDSGLGGRLQMILLGYFALWWAPDRIVAQTPWRHRVIDGGGISLDLGVHFFDQFRYVGGEIETVAAQTAILEPRRFTRDATTGRVVEAIDCDADDTFFAQARTSQGVEIQMGASWAGHGKPTLVGDGTVFYGTRARVSGTEVAMDDGTSTEIATLYEPQAGPRQTSRDFPLGLRDSFALSQNAWLEGIRRREPPETDGREGLSDLAAAMALLESAHAGRRVDVGEVLDGTLREFQRPIDERYGLLDA